MADAAARRAAAGAGRRPADQPSDRPGLFESAFTGGYTLAFVVADVASGEGKEFWHNQKGDRDFSAISTITMDRRGSRDLRGRAAGVDAVVLGQRRRHSRTPAPVMLTPGDGAVEQTAVSPDGRFLFYATNAGDIERRHVWKVPTAGGAAEPLTKGETIETYPAALASGRVAVLGGDAKRPFGVGLVPAAGGAPKYIYPVARAVSARRRGHAAARADEGGRRHGDSQSAVPAEGL